jgi:cytidylate kinase
VEKIIQIAIDGPAGSGKSTIAKKLADKLDVLYVDTGAMYRALTFKVIAKGLNAEDKEAVISLARDTEIRLEKGKVYLDGRDVSREIRSPHVDAKVSRIAEIPEIREIMVGLQRQMAYSKSVIMDGRDIGTHVLPDAQFKFFLTASLDERARRRYKDIAATGANVDFEKVKEEIGRRDELDSKREFAPLRKAQDSIIIDTTGKTINQVLNEILAILGGGADVL